MARMAHLRFWILPVLLVLASVILVACGGDDAPKDDGKGKPITDPARVPSSTPVQNPILYQIRGDAVSTSGGPIGTVTSGTQTPSPSKKYTVKSGDTCDAIARANGVRIEDLLRVNRTIDSGCSNLHEGDVLTIPSTTASPTAGPVLGTGPTPKPSGKTYTVVSGDSCDAIARSYGVKLQDLIALNKLDASCPLQIGQVLKIP